MNRSLGTMPDTTADSGHARESKQRVPSHVAIIMDGNGRWAKEKGRPRIFGHREGALRVDEIVSASRELGVRFLTLYVFSTENWERPAEEVALLMRLLVRNLRQMNQKLKSNQIELRAQGRLNQLPASVQAELQRVCAETARPDAEMILTLCVSYGGQQEIVDAAKRWGAEVASGLRRSEDLTPEVFRTFLYQPNIPPLDLLIRTGGDFRISNFLLWQVAYAEIAITLTYWPDFHRNEFAALLGSFSDRERRFGKTTEQIVAESRVAVRTKSSSLSSGELERGGGL